MATAQDLVYAAQLEVGNTDLTLGLGQNKYSLWFGHVGGGWRAVFVSYCVALVLGGRSSTRVPTASVPGAFAAARDSGALVPSPEPGDIAFFTFRGEGAADQMSIVESVGGGTVTVIEGDSGGSDEDRGEVARRTRALGTSIGFARLPWDPEDQQTPPTPSWNGRSFYQATPPVVGQDVILWQNQMLLRGIDCPTSGVYDQASEDACRVLQGQQGLPVTGIVDAITWRWTWVPWSSNPVASSTTP